MTDMQCTLAVVAAISTALAAGAFLAFSTFVMPALRRLSPAGGLAAMQSINKAAPNPLFMLVLFGPLVVCGVLTAATLRRTSAATVWLCFGSACYLLGLVVTAAYHVPRNNALAGTDDVDAWRRYYPGWTAWNHVRTLALTAASTCFVLAVRVD